jgi:hypothetical protein
MSMQINVPSSVSSASDVSSVGQVAPRRARTSSAPPPPAPGAASATISPRAGLLSKLKQLADTDPAKFKEVTAKLASDLKTQAQSATGDDAKALGALADRLEKASQSGSLDAGRPQGKGGPHGHHGHHHGGPSAAVSAAIASASAAVDQALGGTSTPSSVASTVATAPS